jgi:hypothetical protein
MASWAISGRLDPATCTSWVFRRCLDASDPAAMQGELDLREADATRAPPRATRHRTPPEARTCCSPRRRPKGAPWSSVA